MVQEENNFFSKVYFDNSNGNSSSYSFGFLTVLKMALYPGFWFKACLKL